MVRDLLTDYTVHVGLCNRPTAQVHRRFENPDHYCENNCFICTMHT